MSDHPSSKLPGATSDASVLVQEATALQQAGDLDHAEAIYRTILQNEPEHVTALQLLGVLYNQRGDFEAGARCFREALHLRPRSVMAYLNLGIALWNLRRLDEAQAAFHRALLLNPDNPEALLNRGLVLQELGRHEEVLEDLERLLSLHPEHPSAHIHLGQSLLDLQRPAEALASFERALANQPQSLEARRSRCQALLMLKRPAEALRDLDEVVAARPDDVESLMVRGVVLLELRRAEEALADYDHILRLRPDWLEGLINRHLALLALHRTSEAGQAFERALAVHRRSPGEASPRVVLLMITTLMDTGRYGEALRLLSEPFQCPDALILEAGERARRWHLLLLDWLVAFLKAPLRDLSPFREDSPRYVFPMVVWGDAYLDTLEQFTLPSLMAEGNLPYFQGAGDAHLLFFTTEAGADRLARMPILEDLRAMLPVDILTFPEALTRTGDNYRLMSAMHLACMEVAKASRSHFFFLAPDLVFSRDFLRALDRRLRDGCDVVFAPGLILHLEAFAEEQAQAFPAVGRRLSLAPRDLLGLGMRHVHPFVKQDYVYTPGARRSTVAVFLWPLGGGGFVMHGYHHTPFLISAEAMSRFDGSMFKNLDGDFLPKIIRSEEELGRCVMLTDPAEANYFELSRGNRFVSANGDAFEYDMGEFSLERLSRFGAHLGRVATWLFPQQVCFDPTGQAADDPRLRESRQVVDQIMEGIGRLQDRFWDHP
ncbi:hypothetical protein GETHLI_16620 [Geothrix limicola]|uniref:Tetratricopeptide repeat protein n=1 Tax=Geothrix limicola TaxID=2927978 RepID=A0ABQ5QG81_9BACT|nr:tetratricopeptide repeat protein [Geothrix limicola]GLH73160.1 hypothetical protein GETHLI_16620 [Geothrix limicola]